MFGLPVQEVQCQLDLHLRKTTVDQIQISKIQIQIQISKIQISKMAKIETLFFLLFSTVVSPQPQPHSVMDMEANPNIKEYIMEEERKTGSWMDLTFEDYKAFWENGVCDGQENGGCGWVSVWVTRMVLIVEAGGAVALLTMIPVGFLWACWLLACYRVRWIDTKYYNYSKRSAYQKI